MVFFYRILYVTSIARDEYTDISPLLYIPPNSLSHTVSPAAICETLLLANKWFLKDAVEISGKHDYLGADTTFPIMVLVLVHSNIDNIHLLLHFINEYGETNQCAGEVSYCMTCLQVSLTLNCSILVVSCFMWSGSLDSSGVLHRTL